MMQLRCRPACPLCLFGAKHVLFLLGMKLVIRDHSRRSCWACGGWPMSAIFCTPQSRRICAPTPGADPCGRVWAWGAGLAFKLGSNCCAVRCSSEHRHAPPRLARYRRLASRPQNAWSGRFPARQARQGSRARARHHSSAAVHSPRPGQVHGLAGFGRGRRGGEGPYAMSGQRRLPTFSSERIRSDRQWC